jgi:UDP-N-acetylglucosamine:LPS N-acetylglucosamine transferase
MRGREQKLVLAIASGGGHWQQLLRLRPAFEGERTIYLTTDAAYAKDVSGSELFVVTDANRDVPLKLLRTFAEVFWNVMRTRPDVIISTGAAPGLFGILFGRLVGARTIWIDSIANAEQLSLSGRIASKIAHFALTQWPHLATTHGPSYHGSIL